MKSLIHFSLLFMLSFFIFTSCSNEPEPLNPNGDSELAVLMREMFEDGEKLKEAIESGKIPKLTKKHARILTADATEPEKAASNEYKVFADSYLQILEKLETADDDQLPDLYNNLVNSCMNCHQVLCPGPMVRIKKLYAN